MKKSTKILLLVIFLLILSFSIYFILNQNNTHSLAFVKKVNQYSKNQTNYSAVISKNIDNTNFIENEADKFLLVGFEFYFLGFRACSY